MLAMLGAKFFFTVKSDLSFNRSVLIPILEIKTSVGS